MVKLLRKHRKWILVVGGSLLMIAFLVPQTIQQMGTQPRDMALMRVGGRTVTMGEYDLALRKFGALRSFNPGLIESRLGVTEPLHWLLLTRDAHRAGLVGGPADGAALMQAFVEGEAQGELQRLARTGALAGLTPEQITERTGEVRDTVAQFIEARAGQAAAETRLTRPDFEQALADLRGIVRLRQLYERSAQLSDRRTLLEVKDQAEQYFADALVIPAERVLDQVPAPTEAELEAHVDRFKDAPPGSGELGMGYRLPARAKVEYLELNRAAFEAAVAPDPVDVNVAWRADRARYPGEFAAERARVEADLRRVKVERAMGDAEKIVIAALQRSLSRLERQGAYRVLPADWASTRPSLEAIAREVVDGVKAADNVDIPLPTVRSLGAAWLTQTDLRTLQPVGGAALRIGPQTFRFADLVMTVRELNPETPSPVGLQTGVPLDTPLTDLSGNRFFIGVLDARPPSPPDSIDEVRAQATADLRRLRAFDVLKSRAEEYRAVAASEGLDALARRFTAPPEAVGPANLIPRANEMFFRERAATPDLNHPALVEAVARVGSALDPTTVPGPDTRDARTVAAPLERALALGVATVTARRPLSREDFAEGGRTVAQALTQRQLAEAQGGTDPFALAPLAKRLGFESLRGEDPLKRILNPTPEATGAPGATGVPGAGQNAPTPQPVPAS